MSLNSFNHTSNALKTVASSIYNTSALLPAVLTGNLLWIYSFADVSSPPAPITSVETRVDVWFEVFSAAISPMNALAVALIAAVIGTALATRHVPHRIVSRSGYAVGRGAGIKSLPQQAI
ncbi:hypothetical protein [Epibacterium sp. Ofav1-8]|uniref:hypothetical protein n=1 Tax=Epibacterium sp. Ofav1-8 TaxID=2917735 RepID=UPI001EF41291|nr:hypothetical protein [Epibacterium sp. Ofav1-8]MCG7625926.1 hypothetical protein [Epibacterium sp. Ofav1-8]